MTTPTLAQARETLAAALSAVEGIETVAAHGAKVQLRPMVGWTRVLSVAPAGFRTSRAVLEAYIVLGPTELDAEQQLDSLAVTLLDVAASIEDLPAANVAVEPAVMATSPSTSLPVLVVTLTTEVQ